MKMKIVALLLAISMIMLFVSGCTDTSGTGEEIDEGAPKVGSASDVVELEQVPAGFEQLGVRELEANEVLDGLGSEDTVNTATQGIYKNAANVEIHVNAIECTDTEAAQTMVDDYKLSKLESTERDDVFTEHSFNDHFATRIIWYVTDGGEEVPRYAYIWNTDNIVIQVRGTTSDPNLLLSFAQATGY